MWRVQGRALGHEFELGLGQVNKLGSREQLPLKARVLHCFPSFTLHPSGYWSRSLGLLYQVP